MKTPDRAWTLEQMQVSERRLAELHKQRAGVLLELADDPSNEDIHNAIIEFDRNIKAVEDRIVRFGASLTEAGRRKAEAYAAKQRKDGETLASQAVELVRGARQQSAADIDAAVAALVEAAQRYIALGDEAQRMVCTGLRPIATVASTRWTQHVPEFARAPHGTLTMLLDVLQSRDVRAMRMQDHAKKMADLLETGIAQTLAAADAEQRSESA